MTIPLVPFSLSMHHFADALARVHPPQQNAHVIEWRVRERNADALAGLDAVKAFVAQLKRDRRIIHD